MDFERRRSSGVAKGGLATGIVGTSLGALALMGGGASLLGGNGLWGRNNNQFVDAIAAQALLNGGCGTAWNNGWGGCGSVGPYWDGYHGGCNEDHPVTRYDAAKDAEIAKLKSDIALRDADTYTDQKMLEMYQYIDGRLRGVEGQLAQQAVQNQAVADEFKLAEQRRQCCCDKLKMAIESEARERKCADNSLVNYMNATFYPKRVADVTTGATTTAQALYNPLPSCGCDCGPTIVNIETTTPAAAG